MGQAAARAVRAPSQLKTLAQELTGLATAGLGAGVAWMVVVHQGAKHMGSEVNFARAIGEGRGAELTDIPRVGLWTTLAVAFVISAIALPLLYRAFREPWWRAPIPLALGVFLAWGLWLSPWIGDHTDYPGGLFASDAGVGTLATFAAASVASAFIGARIYAVAREADFWREKDNDLRSQGEAMLEELGLGGDGQPIAQENAPHE